MGRAPCCDKQGLKKGPWTPEEDKILVDYIQSNGHGSWRSLPKLAGLLRCGKSCRLRWTNYLRPDIKRGPFTPDEEKSIIQLHGIVGNKWSIIAAQLPGRTDNEIKNYWNTHLKKKLIRMGMNIQSAAAVNDRGTTTCHMTQWESARLEAEARLSRETLLFTATTITAVSGDDNHPPPPPKSEASDFFLKMWNSEVGDSFRKQNCTAVQSVVPPATKEEEEDEKEEYENKSCITANDHNSIGASMTTEFLMMDESSGSDDAVDTSEEAYQMYLDFAAGEELCVFGAEGMLSGFGSLFSVDEASLDTDFK